MLQCYWSFPAAGGNNNSTSIDHNDQLDFAFTDNLSTEPASGPSSHQAAPFIGGELDPNAIDDATFADIWTDWTQSLPESATGPSFDFEQTRDEEVSFAGEGLPDLFAYLQESAFQEAQQVAAF